MNPAELTKSLKSEAKRLGFELAGACAAVNATGATHLSGWIEAGMAGEMSYMQRRLKAYSHPANVLDGVVSLLMLGLSYQTGAPHAIEARSGTHGKGRVARYAWGSTDYHDLIHDRLRILRRHLTTLVPEARSRAIVDTAPLLEREFAQLAGLGWAAKNTMLINRQLGSWFFLAALLIDQPLVYDQEHATDHCGTCTACLDACPTDAFAKPHVLDATRCISYLTIEHRSAIAPELREPIGDWLFGCDVCQDVCPWNRRATTTDEAAFRPTSERNPIDLIELFALTDEQFRARFRQTPLWRPKRRGILRNAAIVLGNNPTRHAIPALKSGLNDAEELIRGASAWALGRHPFADAKKALDERLLVEDNAEVRAEIQSALDWLRDDKKPIGP